MSSSFPSQDGSEHPSATRRPSRLASHPRFLRSSFPPLDALCRHTWGRPFLWGGVVLAGASSLFLLFSQLFGALWTIRVWAVSLLLMSISTCFFLFVFRVSWPVLWKLVCVGVALLMWGIDLLLPAGQLAVNVSDVVKLLLVCSVLVMVLPARRRAARPQDTP